MEVFGLRHDFLHIGAEHTHPVGYPKHPNSPLQGLRSCCSPIDQRQLHVWSDDRND
jgi:hypothetical protein